MKPYITFNVDGKEFHLRLTTLGIISLEEKLGRNPADIYLGLSDGQLPKVKEIVQVLHQALQPLHNGYSMEKSASLLDSYFSEGKSIYDFITGPMMELFQNAGLLGNTEDEEEVEDNPN